MSYRVVQKAQALGGGYPPAAVVGEALVAADEGASGRQAQCRDQLVVIVEITGDSQPQPGGAHVILVGGSQQQRVHGPVGGKACRPCGEIAARPSSRGRSS